MNENLKVSFGAEGACGIREMVVVGVLVGGMGGIIIGSAEGSVLGKNGSNRGRDRD